MCGGTQFIEMCAWATVCYLYRNISECCDSGPYERTYRTGKKCPPMDMYTYSTVWPESAICSLLCSLHNWRARVLKKAKPWEAKVDSAREDCGLGCGSLAEYCRKEIKWERPSTGFLKPRLGGHLHKSIWVLIKSCVFWVLLSNPLEPLVAKPKYLHLL